MKVELESVVEFLARLVAFPTVSENSNLAMVDFLADRLSEAGARVEIFQDGTGKKANLFATLGPEGDGGVLLSGHCDVVPTSDQVWTTDPFELCESDGKLFGRGTCDMKGFIAVSLAGLPMFCARELKRPLHFAFTYDEETGCIGAGHLAQSLKEIGINPSVAIVGEPTLMRMIDGHKGCNEYVTRFRGFEGHGSLPDHGVNAAEYAARFVAKLLELRAQLPEMAPAECMFDPPYTTINVGALHGGTVQNIIAASAEVLWEMRPVQESDALFVKQHMKAFCDEVLLPQMRAVKAHTSIETEILGEVAGLTPQPDNKARDLVAMLTGNNSTDLVAFGTEAGIYQDFGMDVVVCGPGSIEQAHKADEFVTTAELSKCLAMMERLSAYLAGEVLS